MFGRIAHLSLNPFKLSQLFLILVAYFERCRKNYPCFLAPGGGFGGRGCGVVGIVGSFGVFGVFGGPGAIFFELAAKKSASR
jgi:hypothetical protein